MLDKTQDRANAFTLRLAEATAKYGELLANGREQTKEVKKELAELAKLGKLTPARLAAAIMGKWIEKHPEWKASKKKAELNEDYAVFSDSQRHTCIRIARDSKHVQFIPMSSELMIYELTHYEFEKQYSMHLQDYPVKKAAELYIGSTWLKCSAAAQKQLEYICGKTFKDPVRPTNFEGKESIMTEEAKDKAAKAKKPAAAKPATKVSAKPESKPAGKAADKPVAGKPAAPAATKVAAKPAAAKPVKTDAKPTSKYPDTAKVKVLNKENPHREGTGRADAFDTVVGSKTVGEYLESGHKPKYLESWSKSGHIQIG